MLVENINKVKSDLTMQKMSVALLFMPGIYVPC